MATNNSDILIYDNRTKDFGSDVSRAVRFNIDEQTRTATQTWEAITPKFTGFFGDVDELSGGNVLICTQEDLIWVQPLIHLHILEASKETGETLWSVSANDKLYRAERMSWN